MTAFFLFSKNPLTSNVRPSAPKVFQKIAYAINLTCQLKLGKIWRQIFAPFFCGPAEDQAD